MRRTRRLWKIKLASLPSPGWNQNSSRIPSASPRAWPPDGRFWSDACPLGGAQDSDSGGQHSTTVNITTTVSGPGVRPLMNGGFRDVALGIVTAVARGRCHPAPLLVRKLNLREKEWLVQGGTAHNGEWTDSRLQTSASGTCQVCAPLCRPGAYRS